MKVSIYEEELRLAAPEFVKKVLDGVNYVGIKIGTSDFNHVTLWFESKAAMDEFFTNTLYLIQHQA